ncbi:DUF2971 domain-containing protein [uncultured Psychroserpens sp.]|uniref:DUF2971 domain-containing protein n=1 Tax=uncultured Psychroserpens sp. TaxID=255436 RepID=UPI00261B9937|nr:DUF2971 domain-containing protein [uncultured Psychroserpens sp.]
MSSLLYKYFDFDENFKNSLQNGYLWFSNPNTFNDPFEFKLQVDENLDDTDILEFFELYKKHAVNPSNEIINDFNKVLFMYRKDSKKFIELFLTPFVSHLSNFGVCCFTNTRDNLLMWSHYANKHTGVVLEFENKLLDESIYYMNDSVNMTAIDQINYSNEFPTIKVSSSLMNLSEEIRKVLFTKSNDWKYEKEVRIISPRNGRHLFDPNCLKSIYLGYKFSDENKIEINKLLNKHFPNQDITIKEMMIDDRSYSLKLKSNNI